MIPSPNKHRITVTLGEGAAANVLAPAAPRVFDDTPLFANELGNLVGAFGDSFVFVGPLFKPPGGDAAEIF